ncbi:hypothetical protein JTB14_032441 [Gonioctena quinquepunctata]|nr:hypothetical protein JTB14_032441 [Gonioctena quinquepunctata]
MTSDNFKQICETFKMNSDKVNYNERTRSIKSKLPFSDGNPEDWPIFHSQFEHSIKIFNICEEENIIRLQRCLKGKTREAVQLLLVAPRNVEKIIETLKITFARPELIISNLVDKVRRATPPKEGQFETYLPFSNVIENLVTTMELFNNTGHMTIPSILSEIVMKLPPFLRLKLVEESSVEEYVTLKIFSVRMRKIAIAASSCADINTHNFHEKRVYENDKYQTKRNANIFSTKKFDKCPCCQRMLEIRVCSLSAFEQQQIQCPPCTPIPILPSIANHRPPLGSADRLKTVVGKHTKDGLGSFDVYLLPGA